MSDQEVQQKYMELQMISSQLKEVQQQMEMLSQQINELKRVKESLDAVSEAKKETEIMAPLGSGIFIKTKLVNPSEVLMNVGGDVAVNKEIKDAKSLVENQLTEMDSIVQQLQQQYASGATKAQQLQMEVQKLMAETSKTK